MKSILKKTTYLLPSLFLPLIVFAQPQNFKEGVQLLINIIEDVTLVAVSLSILAFLWGIVLFIARSGESADLEKAKDIMGWGIIALFVLVSFWGIIRVIEATFIA